MERTFIDTIDSTYNEKRIWDFICDHGYTHHIRTWLKQHPGSVRLNEIPVPFYTIMKTGDILRITLLDERSSEKILPVPLPLSIAYEDEDILVVNKAADVPIHPSIGNYENTLANAVAYYYESQGIPFVYRCINRLDRDTTGLLIIAKNMLSSAILSEQMKNRQIHRTYLSLVEGQTEDNGTIDAPIARVGDSVIERQVDYAFGEHAVTHYQRLAYDKKLDVSLLQIQLETGRTHQIRVHMTHIGHPLCGDTLYNPSTTIMTRQALHSYKLDFIHPITKKEMHFTAPLPIDMSRIIHE